MANLRNFTYDNMVKLIRQIWHGVDDNLTEVNSKVEQNTEDISDINETVEGLISQNINPNIFRGTNVYAELQPVNSADTWSTGEWCLYSSASGTNTAQAIELTDSPIDDVEVGWEINNSEGILQSNIPLESGNYTISAYVRGDGNMYLVYLNSNGTSTTQSLGSGFDDWTYVAVTLNNTRDYQTLGFSHSSTSTSGPDGPGGGTTSSTMEICGMKLEKGDSETAWCPSYFDMENKYLQEDLDAVSAEVSEVQSQVTEVTNDVGILQTQVAENTTNINEAQQQITEIIAEGGEPNVIEEIQANGATLAIEDKTVNIPIPTKTSDLENDSDFTTNSEVRSEIAAQIAEIVADAPEDLDTLKEIADWIESHAEDAAAMNSEIKTNTENIADLTSTTDNIQSAVDTLQDQANAADERATALQEQVDSNSASIEELSNEIDNVVTINPNLLRSTNSCTELVANSITDMWDRGEWGSQRAAGLTSIEVTDCPDPDVSLGWAISNASSTSDNFNLVQRGVPYVDGDTYTISCYARGHGVLRVALGSTSWTETCDVEVDSDDWTRIVETGHDTTAQARVLFTLVSDGTQAEVDICGMKLEEGETATAWCPSYFDMENKNLQSGLDEISTAVDSVQEQVTAVQSDVTTNQNAITVIQEQVEILQNQPSYVISYDKDNKTLDISGG